MSAPVLLLQHMDADGPAFLATWLQRQGVPFEVRNSAAGEAFPEHVDGYRAVAVLGGEMSANDPLESLRQAEHLILQAMGRGMPVIGHCLGGQLMARALGASVTASPQPEIGWQTLSLTDDPLARDWFGPGAPQRSVFHWHGEAFGLPPGARLLATSEACAHQAFAIGPHLAMQFHIEIDEAKLTRWAASRDPAFLAAQRLYPTVQNGAAMLKGLRTQLPAQQAMAEQAYARWLGQIS